MFNEFTKFKLFKFKCRKNNKIIWLQSNKKIKNKEDYLKQIKRIERKAILLVSYMSVAYYLNPTLIKCKKKGLGDSKTLGNTFLWSDFLVDIDNKWLDNMIKAITLLKRNGFKDISAYETPHGFQVWVKDFHKFIKEKEDNISNREAIYLKYQRKLANILKKEKIVFDYNVSIDTRRIGRTPLHLQQFVQQNGSETIKG